MKGKRFTEEQIIAVLKEHEAGAPTRELRRRHGIMVGASRRRCFGGSHPSEATAAQAAAARKEGKSGCRDIQLSSSQ